MRLKSITSYASMSFENTTNSQGAARVHLDEILAT